MIHNRLPNVERPQSLRTHITLPPSYRGRLERLSSEQGLSLSDLIRRALDLMLGPVTAPREGRTDGQTTEG